MWIVYRMKMMMPLVMTIIEISFCQVNHFIEHLEMLLWNKLFKREISPFFFRFCISFFLCYKILYLHCHHSQQIWKIMHYIIYNFVNYAYVLCWCMSFTFIENYCINENDYESKSISMMWQKSPPTEVNLEKIKSNNSFKFLKRICKGRSLHFCQNIVLFICSYLF